MGCCDSCDAGGPCDCGEPGCAGGCQKNKIGLVLPGELAKHSMGAWGPLKWGGRTTLGPRGRGVEIGAAAGQGSYRDDSRELANFMSKGGQICTTGFDWPTFLQNVPLHIGNWTTISDIYGTGQLVLHVLPTGMIVPDQTIMDLFAYMVPGMDLTSYLQGVPNLMDPSAVMNSCIAEVNPAAFTDNDKFQASLAYCVNCYGWAMGQGSMVKYQTSGGNGYFEVPMASHIIPIYFGPAGPNYVDANGAPILFAQNIKDLLQTFDMGTTLDRAQRGETSTTVGLKGFVQACPDGSLFGYAGPPTASGQDIPNYGPVPNPNFDPSQPPSAVNPPYIPGGSTGTPPGGYPPTGYPPTGYPPTSDPNAIDPLTGVPYSQEGGGYYPPTGGGYYPSGGGYYPPSPPPYYPPTGGYDPSIDPSTGVPYSMEQGYGYPQPMPMPMGNLIPLNGGGGGFGGGMLGDPMQLVQELLGMVESMAQPAMDMVSPVLNMLPGLGDAGFEVPFMPQGVSDPNFAFDYCTANPMDPACQGDASVMQGEVGAAINPLLLTRKQPPHAPNSTPLTPLGRGTNGVKPHPLVANAGKGKAASSPVVWKKFNKGQRAAQLQRYRKGANSHSKAPDFEASVKKAGMTALKNPNTAKSPIAQRNLALHFGATGNTQTANVLLHKVNQSLNSLNRSTALNPLTRTLNPSLNPLNRNTMTFHPLSNVSVRGESDDTPEEGINPLPFDPATLDPQTLLTLLAEMFGIVDDGGSGDIDPMTYPPDMPGYQDAGDGGGYAPPMDSGGGFPPYDPSADPGAGYPPVDPNAGMPVPAPVSTVPDWVRRAQNTAINPVHSNLSLDAGHMSAAHAGTQAFTPHPVSRAGNVAFHAPTGKAAHRMMGAVMGADTGDFLSSLTNLITSKDKGDPKADKTVNALSQKAGGNDQLIADIASNVIKYAPLLIALAGEGDYTQTPNQHLYELARRGDKAAVHEIFQRTYAGDIEAGQYARRLLGLPEHLESIVMGLYPQMDSAQMQGPWESGSAVDELQEGPYSIGATVPQMDSAQMQGPYWVGGMGGYEWNMSQEDIAHALNQSTQAVTNLMNLAAMGDPSAQAACKAIVEAAQNGNPRAQAVVMLTKPNYLQPYEGTGEKHVKAG